MNEQPPSTRQVSVTEAATILKLSRRTVERRISAGTIDAVRVAGKWQVVLPVAQSSGGATGSDAGAQVAELERQLADMTQNRDSLARGVAELSRQLEAMTGERDYLRNALAASLTRPLEIPERAETLAPRRRIWEFWK